MIRFILALLMATRLFASDPWTERDVNLEGIFALALFEDWGQTLDIERTPGMHEQNQIMGRHPSRATANTYFASAAILHALVADQLSGNWRTAWQITWIGLEAGTCYRNYRLGIRLNF